MTVARVQASVKARRRPCRAHDNFNVSPRLPSKYHAAGGSQLGVVSVSHPGGSINYFLVSQMVCLARLRLVWEKLWDARSETRGGPEPRLYCT